MSKLAPRGKFGHHDMISLNEVYPLSYIDIRWALPGLVSPYCALLEYKGLNLRNASCNSHSKIVPFLKWGRTSPVSLYCILIFMSVTIYIHMFICVLAVALYPYSTQATNRPNRHEMIFFLLGGGGGSFCYLFLGFIAWLNLPIPHE